MQADRKCRRAWQGDKVVSRGHMQRVNRGLGQVLDRFLEAKGKVDAGAAANQDDKENQAIDALHALTSVRALLLSGLQSGAQQFDTHSCVCSCLFYSDLECAETD